MEPIQSSSHGDEAALSGKTSCPLKANGDIWFGCCSCTYFTRDHHGIVSHLVAHGDEQVKCHHPSIFPDSKFKVHSSSQKHKSDKLFKSYPDVFIPNSSVLERNRTHTGEKPFKCELCPQEFTRSSSLKNHNRIHSGERPYKCNLCPQAFAQNFQLRTHHVKHSGENPYKCELCSKAFASRGGLVYHKKTHTGEKPFKCKLCSKAFPQNFHLENHIRMHTGEKPYKCKLCSQAFSQMSHLERHNHRHIAEKPFKPLLLRPLLPKPSQAFAKDSSPIYHNQTHMKSH